MKKFLSVTNIVGKKVLINPDTIGEITSFEDKYTIHSKDGGVYAALNKDEGERVVNILESGELYEDSRNLRVLRDIYELLRFRLH